MKKRNRKKSIALPIILTVVAVIFVLFVLVPLAFSAFDGSKFGNVALIPIEGVITGNGGSSMLGTTTVSARDIVSFIEAADDSRVDVIVLEINSPGGSAVASDEIAAAVKKTEKPVVSIIREVGASGGYWIASASDYIIANRMAITGSIGVISSYLEFSGLMEKYGVGYERLVAGQRKDMGTPFKKLTEDEEKVFQKKLDQIQDYFIEEVAANRNMKYVDVKKIATGEFYLGVEAFNLGLIDQLGNKDTLESYLKETYGLEDVNYVYYQREIGLLEALTGVFSDFFFNIGEGIGSIFVRQQNTIQLM
jgi:protease-4